MMIISGKFVDPIDGVFEGSVHIEGGLISKVTELHASGIAFPESCYIFPGFIDAHVHMREPGWTHKEDFYTGGMAAAHGGVTCVGDMPNLPRPVTDLESLMAARELAKKSIVDVLHYGGVGRQIEKIMEIAPHVPAFKIYTAESTGELTIGSWDKIEKAVGAIAAFGKPVSFHCESQDINDSSKEKLKDKSYPWKHCDERPVESETSAVEKVIEMSRKRGASAHIAHMSAEESLKIVSDSKEGMKLTCEAAPHHLYFTKKDMERSGNLLKVNCPLREEKDRRALLAGLRHGEIDMLATDHAPHTLEEKQRSAPSGMPHLDTFGNFALWLMLENNFEAKRIAQIASLNPARFFSLRDRGRISEGRLASFTILDTAGSTTIRNSEMRTKCGWSPFDGVTFPGRVACTIHRGRIIWSPNSQLNL